MAFVNEYISEEDFQKYGIAGINIKRGIGATSWDAWTVDKDRNVYIRQIGSGNEWETQHESRWTLFYQNQLIEFGIENLAYERTDTGSVKARKKIGYIDLPEAWAERRSEVIAVIHEALTASKGSGVLSSATDYSLTLDI